MENDSRQEPAPDGAQDEKQELLAKVLARFKSVVFRPQSGSDMPANDEARIDRVMEATAQLRSQAGVPAKHPFHFTFSTWSLALAATLLIAVGLVVVHPSGTEQPTLLIVNALPSASDPRFIMRGASATGTSDPMATILKIARGRLGTNNVTSTQDVHVTEALLCGSAIPTNLLQNAEQKYALLVMAGDDPARNDCRLLLVECRTGNIESEKLCSASGAVAVTTAAEAVLETLPLHENK